MSGEGIRTAQRSSTQVLERVANAVLAVIAATPAAVVVSLGIGSLARRLSSGPELTDYRVGSLVWFGASKSGEGLQLVALTGLLALAVAFAVRATDSRAPGASDTVVPPVVTALAILAAPAVIPFLIGAAPGLSEFPGRSLVLVVVLQAVPGLHFALSRLRSRGASGMRGDALGLDGALVLAGCSIAAIGLLIALRYAIAPRSLSVGMHAALLVSMLVGVAVVSAMTPVGERLAQPASQGWIVTVAGLAALPLLLPPLMVRDGIAVVARGVDHRAWVLVLLSLGAAAVVETWWRSQATSIVEHAPFASLPIALLIVPLRAEHAWPSVSNDDFHFGEVFVPFKVWLSEGAVPYVDLTLVRGIVPNMLTGALNQLVSDGTAAVYAYGLPLAAVLVMTGAHLLLRSVVGVGMATAMVALFGLANHFAEADLLLFAVMISVLGHLRSTRGGAVHALGVIAAGTLGILAYPLMGLAIGLTLAGVGLTAAVGGLLSSDPAGRRTALGFLTMLLAGTLAVAASPLRPLLSGALRYVVDNARANEEANAIALDLTLMIASVDRVAPFAFMVAALVSLGLLVRTRASLLTPSWHGWLHLATAATPLVLVVGLFGRFAGRVDPVAWSYRPSAGAVALLGVALPSVLVLSTTSDGRRAAWWSIGGAAMIAANIHPLGGVLPSSLGMVRAPYVWTSSSHAAAIPLIGHGQGDPRHLMELSALARATELLDKPTVINLTNRNALDVYFGWFSSMRVQAPYNLESSVAEAAAIASLSAAAPDFLLLSPSEWHESESMSLRTPHLARHLMEEYLPFRCEGWTWAAPIATAHGGTAAPGEEAACEPPMGAERRTELWSVSIGAPEWLAMAPAAWGRWGPLRISEAARPISVRAVEEAPGVAVAHIPAPAVEFRSAADILLLESSCPSRTGVPTSSHRQVLLGTAPSARLVWDVPGGALAASNFVWGVGRFAIPLDAYPSWHLLRHDVDDFRLDLPSGPCPEGWRVDLAFVPRPSP